MIRYGHFIGGKRVDGASGLESDVPCLSLIIRSVGWKNSSLGDLNQHDPDAIRSYTKTKTVTSRWPSSVRMA